MKKYIALKPLAKADKTTINAGEEIELEDTAAKILLSKGAIKEMASKSATKKTEKEK